MMIERRRYLYCIAVIQISLDDDRMHVRFSADGRRVTELRGDQPDCGGDIPLRIAIRLRGANIRQHGRGAQRPAPCPEVLGAVRKAGKLLQVLVHFGGLDVAPFAILGLIAKQPAPRNLQQRLDEARKVAAHDSLAMPDRALADVVEDDPVAIDGDVRLPQRGETERPVLLRVPVVADAKEAVRKEPDDSSVDFLAREIVAPKIRQHSSPNRGKIARHLSHAIVLPALTSLHRVGMIAILLAAANVEAPRLNRGPLTRGDVNVGPRGWYCQRIDLSGTCGIRRLSRRRQIAETSPLAASSGEPGLTHVRRFKQEGCLPGPRAQRRLYSAHALL